MTLFQRMGKKKAGKRDIHFSQQYTVLRNVISKATFLLDVKIKRKQTKKGKSFDKGICKHRVRFILEERGSDEQEEKTKGLALNSLGSSTVKKRMSKHHCAPWQSSCKDAGVGQKN